uniref:L-lactate dehydrogenase (cytochrome) n=1 Tax=Ganoderma boninense TaxID=34458 RepID=A0A5K1JV01_9APHY|nr:Amidohydrolase family protein [Ganoderma boninense]
MYTRCSPRFTCYICCKVYDVTDFLDGESPEAPQPLPNSNYALDHPGGSRIILKYAGKDATAEYDPIHPPDAITTHLPPEKHLGSVDPGTVEKVEVEVTDGEKQRLERVANRPSLSEILNLHDFEAIARMVMPEKAWAYYSSAAEDEITNRENHVAYHRIWWRPRILRDVTHVDWSTKILGHASKMPLYITATALGKLGHPDGELNLTKAAAKHGVIQMIPTLASCAFDELVDAAQPGQVQFLQLYVNRDREITKKFVQHAEKRGIKALFITVDAPQLGRREKVCSRSCPPCQEKESSQQCYDQDMRQKFEAEDPAEVTANNQEGKVDRMQGAARAISSFIDPGLDWKDIPWFQSITKMPLILKGVQCWEDALQAYDAGLAGVVLSNHGGRQLDFARSGVEVLAEVVRELGARRSLAFPNARFQLFVDGGVRRANDVLKAVALGATAVGVGRPFLYAFSAYGFEGVDHALDILADEFEMNMRLIGARNLKEVVPDMVDASSLKSHIVPVPGDRLFDSNYESMQHARLREVKSKF